MESDLCDEIVDSIDVSIPTIQVMIIAYSRENARKIGLILQENGKKNFNVFVYYPQTLFITALNAVRSGNYRVIAGTIDRICSLFETREIGKLTVIIGRFFSFFIAFISRHRG